MKARMAEKLPATLLLAAAMIFGAWLRLAPALSARFPLNDGGLFYTMIVDLLNNHFLLPQVTTYNSANIPFAYPPLAFYFAGLLHSFFGWSLLDLVRVVPALISTLTIVAFGLLARELLKNRTSAAFATLAFALLPRTFDWLIMGGGLTRSFGLLLALLALWQVKCYFDQHSLANLGCFTLLSALIVYTHPEAIVHTAIGVIALYLFFDRTRRGIFSLLACAAVILAITSPWWGLVLARHGLSPFLAARVAAQQDAYNPIVGLVVFFRFYFTDEPFTSLLAVLGLLGIFGLLAHKQPALPVWLFVTHFLEPRGGSLYMMLPLALGCGYALNEMILPALNLSFEDEKKLPSFSRCKAAYGFLAFFLLYSLFSAYYVTAKVSGASLTPADLEAFAWVENHIPSGSRFAILTGAEPLRDSTSEWFPAITGDISVTTVFGYEWVNDGLFSKRTENYRSLQTCLNQDTTCLNNWAKATGLGFDYIYIRKDKAVVPALVLFLNQSAEYQPIYNTENVAIFGKK